MENDDMKHFLVITTFLVFAICHGAQAEPVHYEFSGLATGTLNLGSGAMALGNTPFTAIGDVTNETDLKGDPLQGIFAATTVYEFAGVGTFVTNPGGDYYSQYGAAAGTIDRVGLVNSIGSTGFAPDFVTSPISVDPNIPQAIGMNPTLTNPFNAALPHFLSNASGHTLTFTATNVTAFDITSPVPLPAAQWLLASALAWLGLQRRHRGVQRHPGA